jgi:hydroxymethylpyrimidine pyrophosphatase-like HAD family hydrolase
MTLRCVYTDIDGTIVGKGASLLRDAEGNFSTLAVRALEACDRGGVEVVLKSGRRKPQVAEDARLIGQGSYIYEMGTGLVDGPEEVLFAEPFDTGSGVSVHDQIARSGVVDLLFERFPNKVEHHSPWHEQREFSHLLRGEVDLLEAERLFADNGHSGLRLVDNGITTRRSDQLAANVVHVYHLIPAVAGKGKAIAAHMRRRQYSRDECIAVGDARGDLESADAVGRFYLVSNALDKDPDIVTAVGGRDNVTITEEPMIAGFYEAVVRTLAEG